ncbi:MAG: methyltransferase [Fimbriimonas sp.]
MKRAALLDPRPEAEAAANPIADAVNIPLWELTARTHELPPPGEPLRLPDLPAGREAGRLLAERGRQVEFAPFAFGPSERGRLWRPNPFLESVAPDLNPGSALDIGCGSGRDAVFLASLGWHVTALDILPDALDRGRDLAARYLDDPTRIDWVVTDVHRSAPSGQFDLVTMFAFLHRPLLLRLPEMLNPGGSLILETFTTEHRARHGRPASPDLAVDPEKLPHLAPGLRIEHADAAWRGDRHTARLWARRE